MVNMNKNILSASFQKKHKKVFLDEITEEVTHASILFNLYVGRILALVLAILDNNMNQCRANASFSEVFGSGKKLLTYFALDPCQS